MQRVPEGGFEAQVELPWDTTIFYKFVQDGAWLIDSQQPHCDDGGGQINNYCTTPKAPGVAPNTAAPTETTLPAVEAEVRPAAISKPSEPAIIVKDHSNEAADEAPTVPAPPAEAKVVPLAAAVEHPTNIVAEATTGPETHADPPAPSLPIVEVLSSSDPLPTTAPVEPATSEPSVPTVAAPAETAPAPVVGTTPAPVTEAAPTPAAEVVPTVDDIVYATANTDATADAVVAAARETAAAKETVPATVPAAVTDIVVPAATEATPAKVDAAVAEDTPTASTSETPAKAVGQVKDAKPVDLKDAKAPTTQPAAATKTEETQPKLRLDSKGTAKGDRRSRTYSTLKEKLFPSPDHEKTNGVSEHGDAQVQTSVSTEGSPTREKHRSFFGRVASIFKPSS
jgi:hypothetical protein